MSTNRTVLVTGGTGFVGMHVIMRLLQQGFKVKTTVRSLNRKNELLTALRQENIDASQNITFHQADLTKDEGWKEAIADSGYILHVASPFPAIDPENENDLIIPARDGALRVLREARNAGVKRVVLTSSFAAVGYSKSPIGHTFTEEDWTDADAPVRPYIRSKTIAEKAAWDFIATEGDGLELSVINPVGIFGPVLGGISSASIDAVIKGLLEGIIKSSPEFTLGVVDVRDIASIHIDAMLSDRAAGQRFLATSDNPMSFYDIAQLIKKERPQYAGKIEELNKTDEKFYIRISNEKARTTLGWQPRTRETSILASVDSLMK